MNVEREPPVGTLHTAADGSRWRKVRTLGERAWADALVEALAARRTGAPVTEEHVRAMGYERVGGGPS